MFSFARHRSLTRSCSSSCQSPCPCRCQRPCCPAMRCSKPLPAPTDPLVSYAAFVLARSRRTEAPRSRTSTGSMSDVTAASGELAMITSSRGSPKRLCFSEKCLEPQLLRTTTECCCLCGCMVLVLLVLVMLQLYSFIVVLLCPIPRNGPPICRESCEKNP